MTNSQRIRDSAPMMSSTTPSAKYSCSGSPLRFRNGSTASEGFSGSASVSGGAVACSGLSSRCPGGSSGDCSLTSATNRKPLRGIVRITLWASPLSPSAFRTALIWLVRVNSETNRPFHTDVEQLVLAHHALAIADEVDQKVEHLRPDRNCVLSARKLPAVGIEHEISEQELQFAPPAAAHGTCPHGQDSNIGKREIQALHKAFPDGRCDDPRLSQGVARLEGERS